MSHVCLQFGQCGNQLGYELFSVIYSDINATNVGISGNENLTYCDKSLNKWFRRRQNDKLTARAVLVDTEKKVIKNIREQIKSNRHWEYNEDNFVLNSSSGSANNWALGYKVKGPDIREQTIDLVRKECEHCDRVESILSFSSSAGGTGSGVGSYLTEQLHDEFSNKYFFNFIVLPYRAGEVVTQNFNTLFMMSKLYDSSDAIFLFENDELHKIMTTQLQITNVTFPDLNKVIGEQIASVFQPFSKMPNITDNILAISAHSQYKLLSVKSTPFVPATNKIFEPVPNWMHLRRNIVRALKEPIHIPMIKSKKPKEPLKTDNYSRAVGNLYMCRGIDADKEIQSSENFNLNLLYSKWVPKKKRFVTFTDGRKFLNKDRFATLVTNNSSTWSVLDSIIAKSWETYIHDAYVHQYTKYGVEKDDFVDMFVKMEKIVKNYKNL